MFAQMPELPEVEYVRRQLRRAMAGARIERVEVRRPKLRYALPSDFGARLEGQAVRAVTRRAKYLLVELASGDVLLMHLGMSGWFHLDRTDFEAHDHVVFRMSNGATVVFNDPRRFGFMTLAQGADVATHRMLGRLGPEPLARAFDAAVLAAALARRKTTLKAALSDQRVVAGLGNIYVSEALYRARLSPKRRASTLVTRGGTPRAGAHALVEAIRTVLKKAIAHQHRPRRDDPFLVYDREGQRCRRDGCRGVIKRIVQGGRSTFYCPVCQR
jgi:formamidopyrimidine-DNA glycosylase